MFLDAGLTGAYRFPVYGVLVDHEEGRFVFDTGFDIEHIRNTVGWTDPEQTAEQTIPAQLHLAGFRPEEISHVINSHYHLDHCGGNKYCKACDDGVSCLRARNATIAGAERGDPVLRGELRTRPSRGADQGRATDMFTPRFETLKGDQEIASGVFLFETAGHTAGHYSLMVKLKNRRPMLFAADACYSRQNLDLMCIQAGNHDPAAARGSLQRLKDLAEKHDAEIFFSHDADSWPKYSRAPGFYS